MENRSIDQQMNLTPNGNPMWFQTDLRVEQWDKANLGVPDFIGTEFSSIAGIPGMTSYPICIGRNKDICVKCKAEAKSKPKSGWLRKGKENYSACFTRELAKKEAAAQEAAPPGTATEYVATSNNKPPSGSGPSGSNSSSVGMSLGGKIGIGVGVAALLGVVIYFATKKPSTE